MLYVTFLEPTHLINVSLYPLTNISPFPLPTPSIGQQAFYYFWEFNSFRFHTVFALQLSNLFHLAWCLQGQPILLQIAGFPFFLWLNNISFYTYTHTHTTLQVCSAVCNSLEFSRQNYWNRLPFPPPPRDQTNVSCISCISRRTLYHWAIWVCVLNRSVVSSCLRPCGL